MSADERMAQAFALEQMKERAERAEQELADITADFVFKRTDLEKRAERAEAERDWAVGNLKAEKVANQIARNELEAARDEDQEACRVVMAERDELLARLQKAESDARTAHAGAAAMREALKVAAMCFCDCRRGEAPGVLLTGYKQLTPCDHEDCVKCRAVKCLQNDAGAALLERLARADEKAISAQSEIGTLKARLAQSEDSLDFARLERSECLGLMAERDTLRARVAALEARVVRLKQRSERHGRAGSKP